MPSLIGECANALGAEEAGAILHGAYEEVEDQEDEHLYHTNGWSRELWLNSLGLKAVLPPPEEKRDVKTAAGRSQRGKNDRMNSPWGPDLPANCCTIR